MTPPRRKKWTEAEEKTLIDKYGEMVTDGTLAKMKTREKKYKPIASYVNSIHHLRDPVAYPWQWTWKDVSTKVQNMRHQYSLVKQKIKRPESSVENSVDEFDLVEGITYWSNFLRYKEVFGDVAASCGTVNNANKDLMVIGNEEKENERSFLGAGEFDQMEIGHLGDGDYEEIDIGDTGEMGFNYECEGEERGEKQNANDGLVDGEVDTNINKKRKLLKGSEKKAFGFLVNQLKQLKEMEARFEQREVERERERQRREKLWMERERDQEKRFEEKPKEREETHKSWQKLRKQRVQEWEAMEEKIEDRERRRRELVLNQESEWEEKMKMKRSEWKKTMDDMLSQHRAEMGQMQTRILHEQQNFTGQFVAFFSQWTGHPTGLSDHTGSGSHYFSHMMQNMHHLNGMVHGDSRVEGENQDDQFIVDE